MSTLTDAAVADITVTDPVLLDQFRRTGHVLTLHGPDGEVVGAVHVPNLGIPPPGWKSPFTDEELAELRKQRGGRPLADILRDIGARP